MTPSVVTASICPASSAVTQSGYRGYSTSWTAWANLSLTCWAGVEPVTEQSLRELSVSGPVMSAAVRRTSRSWPVVKYGPANDTCCLRLSVIE